MSLLVLHLLGAQRWEALRGQPALPLGLLLQELLLPGLLQQELLLLLLQVHLQPHQLRLQRL